jgi:hypothetical protein
MPFSYSSLPISEDSLGPYTEMTLLLASLRLVSISTSNVLCGRLIEISGGLDYSIYELLRRWRSLLLVLLFVLFG